MWPRIVIIDSPLRSFQYKILNNILYLNEQLYINLTLLTIHYAHSVELTTSQSNTYFVHVQ